MDIPALRNMDRLLGAAMRGAGLSYVADVYRTNGELLAAKVQALLLRDVESQNAQNTGVIIYPTVLRFERREFATGAVPTPGARVELDSGETYTLERVTSDDQSAIYFAAKKGR